MTNRAFGRFSHVIGYICLIGAMLDVIGYQGAEPGRWIWPALVPLAVAMFALILVDRWRTTLYCVLFLVVGGIAQFSLSTVLILGVPASHTRATLVFSLVAIALSLIGGPGFVPSSAILWGVLGFAVSQVASFAAALVTGTTYHLDVIVSIVAIGLVVVVAILAVTRARRLAVRTELDRAVVDEELSALRYRIEVRAAAIIHDMVLNHLTAISTGPEGTLNPVLAHQIEQDLAVLTGDEWLRDPSPELQAGARRDWRRSSLFTAVQEARELSLVVDVTGDLGAVGRLTVERDDALGLAVKQCLVNVLRHAQTESAEVVILGSDADVSIMIIDAGRGFSEQLIASDRLGLRQSVRRRIELVGGDVRLWSTPGRGTSVMIRVPAALGELVRDD